VEEDTRIRAYRHFVEMIPDAGWSGFGPGTFDKTYRPYVRDEPKLLKVPLWLAHQDYIQTVVEWGWLGFLLWTAILIPGAFGIARGIFSDPGLQSLPRTNFLWGRWDAIRRWFLAIPEANQPILLAGVGTALLLTAIHAAFDFPMQVPSLAFYFLVWTSLGWSLLERRKPLSYEEDDED
jgi:O-antigen ligase